MTSLVGGPLGCFARGQEMVSFQDRRASILRLITALWKGPAPHGCRQGLASCSLLWWQWPLMVARVCCMDSSFRAVRDHFHPVWELQDWELQPLPWLVSAKHWTCQ